MPEESSNIIHLSVFDNDIDWLPHQPTEKHRHVRKAERISRQSKFNSLWVVGLFLLKN